MTTATSAGNQACARVLAFDILIPLPGCASATTLPWSAHPYRRQSPRERGNLCACTACALGLIALAGAGAGTCSSGGGSSTSADSASVYGIATSPEQARGIINAGKMAVVLGIEISTLFDCFLTTPYGFLIEPMMKLGMLIEVDHFPRKAYRRVFEILNENDYPAVGSHGLGFGFDLNGFAGASGPRFGSRVCGSPQTDPLICPFTSYAGDVTFRKPKVGVRTLDFNTEGFVHVGLLPEMIEDVRRDGVRDEELEPLFRSAEINR